MTFVARGAHLAALHTAGLTIESGATPLRLSSVRATDDPASAGAVDVVMFCTKLWDVEAAGKQIAPVDQGKGRPVSQRLVQQEDALFGQGLSVDGPSQQRVRAQACE
ncbi:MAG: hypothetical protein N3D71_10090, partial [Burkholderiaceae bacterium]|nr:hypothetical protein [Burkholderiaceae bacterium]